LEVTLAAKEILQQKIDDMIQKYPASLKPKDIQEIMNCSQTQAYDLLNNSEIPSAKKLDGLGWRIPRETFLAWWYGEEVERRNIRRIK